MVAIKIVGSANMAQVESQFAAITAQVSAMNAELAKSAMIPAGGNPAGFARASRAANAATMAYNHALASSGAFRVEQLKINDAVSKQTELLEKQKLSFRQTFGKKNRDMMRAVYREQLAMQQAVARTQRGMVGDGKTRMSLGVPTEVSESWDSLNNRVGFFRTRLASASAELVNWGKNTQWAGRQLMAGISMPVAAFGAAAGVMAYQVDKQLTRIQKVYDTTADQNSQSLEEIAAAERELASVREAGMRTATMAAKAYGSSVTDTLEVQAELAATGQTGVRLQESTAEVMRIATLGEIEHADATKALISLQAVLGHTARETADDFNYLNSIENATSLSTNDFVAAIPRALGPMKEMGGSLQDLAILMVAMKERGIEAGEGANAIKAMMQRLYRPSQQVREEWQQIAKVDPLKFVEESGGNVMEILPKIAEATKDLGKADRVKLLAGLFGTYQVTRMSAMLKGIDDMNEGIGQTSRVLEVNRQTTEEWANTASNELAKQAESASGRFKRAWEGMRAELAALGEPFLDVASKFLELASAVLGFVNNLPGWAKKGIIFGAMIAALVGPVVMLIGLFANFAGNIGKFAASTLRWVTSFEFLNKSQLAARISASMAETAFMKEAAAGEVLENQLKAIALASEQSAIMMSRLAGVPLPAGFPGGPPAPVTPAAATTTMGRTSAYAGYSLTQQEQKFYNSTSSNLNRDIRLEQARVAMANEYMKANGQVARDATEIQKRQAAANRITASTASHMNGMVAASAAMAGSMILMSGAAGDTGADIGKWLMLMTIAAPAMQGLSGVVSNMGTKFKTAVKDSAALAKNSAKNAGGVAKAAGGVRTMGAGIKGAAVGLAGMMGPVGWITAALVAAGGSMYLLHKNAEESLARQIEQQEALNKTTSEWAGILDVAERKRKSMFLATYEGAASGTSIVDQANMLKDSESGKALLDAYADTSSEGEKNTIALGQYLQILRETNATAADARHAVEVLFVAAGDGALEASRKAKEMYDTYGSISDGDMTELWRQQFTNLLDGLYGESETAGVEMGKILADSIASSANGEAKNMQLDAFQESISGGWESLIGDLQGSTQDLFSDIGVDETNVRSFIAEWKKVVEGEMSQTEFLENYGLNVDAFDPRAGDIQVMLGELNTLYAGTGGAADNLREAEAGVVKELSRQLGISKELTTMSQLRATWEWQLFTASKKNAQELYDQRISSMQSILDPLDGFLGLETAVTDEQKLQVLNQIRIAMGMSEATDLAQGFKEESKKASDETKKIGDNLRNLPTGISIQIKAEDMKSILKSGMEGVQSDLSDMISDDFDNRMENAVEANTSYWDNAIERMQDAQEAASARMDARHEAETNRFENRWERRKDAVSDAYDARIENINNAIEAEQKAEEIRQRIFEAEQTRLDRLTEAANRTIDFNMAMQTGDLDEAAKIRNDMDAAAQEWALTDAAARGATASERRQARLENRADNVGEAKDKALEALEEREEAERRSLERRQEMERKHLEKVQEMNLESLQAQADAAKEAFQSEWEARKDSLEDQLDAFKSFVPKNQKQLRKWMDLMDIDYENFGLEVLRPKSDKWGKWFNKSLRDNIKDAGRQIASDNMWESMGADVAKEMLLGMGFGSMGAFKKFIMTGKLPDNFGKVKSNSSGNPYGGSGPAGNGLYVGKGGTGVETRHTGGVIGGAGGSRKGVARGLKGLHPNETMVRAQKGEFMVNKDSARKHGALLEAVNSGVYDPSVTKNGNLGGAAPAGIAGLMAGTLARMLSVGVGQALNNAYSKAAASLFTGSFGSISAGTYGDTSFTAEQLKNAQTIASVGKQLGATSRDIVIALMTAMQESGLRNLSWGDRDSVGLFQQRDAWGSFEARTNPAAAARMFFTGGAAGQRGLFDIANRNSLSLTEAAQAVQVSAYPDAYAKWADEAQAIFNALKNSGGAGFVMGNGKSRAPLDRPWSSSYNIHGTPSAVDLAVPVGRNVYATADGTVVTSKDLRGNEPRAPHGGLGYYSYGRYIVIRHDNGANTLYAHLSERYAREGQRVAGGSVIGKSGDTGYSYGPHVHFGATNGPLAWLKTGGQTINDGIAMLHRGETVLTKPLSEELQHAVRAFGRAGKEKLSGRRRKMGIDPSERNMWGPETNKVEQGQSSFWTWLNTPNVLKKLAAADSKAMDSITDTGAKGVIRIGTLNTTAGVAATNTNKDLARLIPKADFLALTEVTSKFDTIKKWLGKHNWGLLGGRTREQRESVLAFNRNTQKLEKAGIRKLGDKTNNSIVGGPMKRYANYGLFTDRDSGRKTWQVSAHTVPTPRMSAKHRPLFMEQWGNLDKLVDQLQGTGSPVFVAGDLNNNPNRDWWRTPGGLRDYRGEGVDWIFGDPKLSKSLGMSIMRGMHGDHGKAVLSNFALPSHKNGAENIKWDNTLVNLHKKESVLTAEQSDKFRKLANNIDDVAAGAGNEYNVNVYVTEPGASADEIANKVIGTLEKIERRKPTRRRS